MPQSTFLRLIAKGWKASLVVFLVGLYLAVNVFRIGGDAFIYWLNNNLANPLAVIVTALTLLSWRRVTVGNHNRLLWSGLMVGWLLWTVAEFWWGINSFVGQEAPYPSWADFFWVIGYIPMAFALWNRIRSLPQSINMSQIIGIGAVFVISTGATIAFVLLPIVRNAASASLFENVLNILYPFGDLILLVLVLRILFSYQQGRYGRAWGWLSAGFILHSIAGILFSYANVAGIYYPGGQITLFSTVGVDVPYNVSYVCWIVGLLQILSMVGSYSNFKEISFNPVEVHNTHLVVFTKRDYAVIEVSQNYPMLFAPRVAQGCSLAELFGIAPEEATGILDEIKANQVIAERDVWVNTLLGARPARVSGMAVINPQGEFSGANLLLRLSTDDYGPDGRLSGYEKGMVAFLLKTTGTMVSEENEIKQLLSNYYLAYIKSYYNRLFAEGGGIMAYGYLVELQAVAKQRGWQIDVLHQDLSMLEHLPLATLQQVLPGLAAAAGRVIVDAVDETTLLQIGQDVRSRFDENTLKKIAHFDPPAAQPA